MFVRVSPSHGVRRRREDAVEIEELDSRTMRQSSYNYFQQHNASSSLLRASTFKSSLGRSPASRKRQRTLAEQLDDMCLQGPLKDTKHRRRRAKDPRIVELDDCGREKASSMDGSGSDSDGMVDTSGLANSPDIKVYGEVDNGGLRGFFAAGAGERHRPMDLMYRHYVALAQAAVASTPVQGNELVVFRPPKPAADKEFTEDLPAYLSLTPHEFEKLTMKEKRQWYQAHSRYMRELDHIVAERKEEIDVEEQLEAKPTEPVYETRRRSSSASSSRSYQVLGVPSIDGEEGCAFDGYGDVEMMEDDEDNAAPKVPHPAGELTHSEWFTDDEL
ncbi:hypothetical protein PHYBOEH_012036 [Phytophthora boehmeriae]|uniref:Uncharacterized protein n=1 Tax=Phytophthora boehmeriae TaxID=109152 RepID=A0A8T1VDF0_9STRA|nr:hypothetical protein PHYBOEH_012036 [Phytophthora boehmeriae]